MTNKKPKLLLTRSNDENKKLASELSKYFYICSWPLISYNIVDGTKFCKEDQIYYIVITSKFAAKIIATYINFNINCFVVGKISAQTLQKNKFIRILAIYNTVQELVCAIHHVRNILYYCGNYTAFIPPNYWKTQVIYEVKYTNYIDDMVKNSLSLQEIDYGLIYSYNTGHNLIKLLDNNKLLWTLQYIRMICISQKVGSLFQGITKEVYFPAIPTNANMIKILLNYGT